MDSKMGGKVFVKCLVRVFMGFEKVEGILRFLTNREKFHNFRFLISEPSTLHFNTFLSVENSILSYHSYLSAILLKLDVCPCRKCVRDAIFGPFCHSIRLHHLCPFTPILLLLSSVLTGSLCLHRFFD